MAVVSLRRAGTNSLGGEIASTAFPAQLRYTFTPQQFVDGRVEYRCFYVRPILARDDLKVWIETDTPSDKTSVAIGWGAAAIDGTEPEIAQSTTAPAGVVFTSPVTEAEGLNGGDFTVGQYRALWIRYTISPTTTILLERFSIAIDGTVGELLLETGDALLTESGDTLMLG